MIEFGQPLWLYGLAAAIVLLTAWSWWTDRRSRRLLERFVAGSLVDRLASSWSRPRQRVKSGLSVLACLLLLLALARPQWGSTTEEIELRGVDVLFALDTSRSMLAQDYQPNRLERAKLAILDLVSKLEGDRVGLIAFAGDAFLQCPLTLDYGSFLMTLDALTTDTIPRGGTDVAAAIEEALAYFQSTDHHRVLILISDGEDLEASGIQRAREAAAEGVSIFTVGVGSPEGALIPLSPAGGRGDYLRDHTGNPVRTRLDEASLQAIAQVGNGLYQKLGRGAGALDDIYAAARSAVDEATLDSVTRETPIERYHWPLALGLLCLVLEWGLGNRRRLQSARPVATTGLAVMVVLAALGPGTTPAHASPRQAERLYQAGNYEEAISLWRTALETRPNEARLHYNLGNAHYRQGEYELAIAAYQAALPHADVVLQERIFFNLGNAQFQQGQQDMGADPGRTRALWDEALQNYNNSLTLNPEAEDARGNRQWVEQQFAVHGARIEVMPAPARGGSTSPGGLFLPGMVLELRAEANPGWRFATWHGADVEEPENATTAMVVRQNAEVLAVFRETRELVVASEDEAQGSAGTSGTYDLDQEVPIEATAADYFAFERWISDTLEVAEPTAAQTTVTLSQDGTVTARFTDAYRLEVLADPPLAGNVGNTGFYPRYAETPIQAEARDGFEWLGWIGDDIAERYEPQTSVTLNGDRTAVAHFERIWSLVVLPDRDEHGTTSGGGNFPVGSLQPIQATPNEGHTFIGWEGPGVLDPTAPQTTVEVLSPTQDISAIFEQEDGDGEDGESSEESEESEPSENSEQSEDSEPSEESDESEESDSPDDQERSEEDAPPEEPAEEEPVERETPESLTEEEAQQLLQLLRQDERQLPLRIRPLGEDETTTGRDW